jgi:hypothetical protein
MSPDPENTFRVRDVQLFRGDIKIYLTEGVLSFLTPVDGKQVAAVFTTEPVEAGDAEVIVLPPQRNERAALARFTKTPNLDEHFTSALFLFTDETVKEVLDAIQQGPVRKMPEAAVRMTPTVRSLVQTIAGDIRGRLIAGLLDLHDPEQGFFYGVIGGKTLGVFDLLYNPVDFEQVTIGRGSRTEGPSDALELWSSFRSRRSGPYTPPAPPISHYSIEAEIRPDLTLAADAKFEWRAAPSTGRVIPLFIADKLQVDSAKIDGRTAEIFQQAGMMSGVVNRAAAFYLVAPETLAPGPDHDVEVRYHGSVIRKTDDNSYFVDDRNAWFPFARPTLANFDLTFRCPDSLQLVSTGEPVSDTTSGGIRTVHRVTRTPEAMAGFNLGEYDVSSEDHGRYRIDCYRNKRAKGAAPDIPEQTAALLDYYTERWIPLPLHEIAITPIPATFGQGFPGLVYLSDIAYERPEDRPESLQTPALTQFFSELLLPHEVAHQWWGNLVTSAEYRSAWIMEALANYSALQFVANTRGKDAQTAVLNDYRSNLNGQKGGRTVESYGPLELGVRLMQSADVDVWHRIVYEKGTWVIHMLQQRLGEDQFLNLERRLLHDFSDRPITNEDFRKVAAEFVPSGQPDKSLSSFFDTWVYGTGIPQLELKNRELTVSAVDDDFTADVPLHCHSKGTPDSVRWTRVSTGSNPLEWTAGTTCELPPESEFLYVTAR